MVTSKLVFTVSETDRTVIRLKADLDALNEESLIAMLVEAAASHENGN